jgi:hypothetical protein
MAGYDGTKLNLATQHIGNTVAARWDYTTAADSDATITGALYFSDGDKRGMKVGDLVDVVATTGPKYKRYQVTVVTVGSGATVAAPTAIT